MIDELLCKLCGTVPMIPVESSCSHLFCKDCLEHYKQNLAQTCPMCEAVLLDAKPASTIIHRLTRNIKVMCRNLGCIETTYGTTEALTQHYWRCPMRLVRCVAPGCEDYYKVTDQRNHERRCMGRTVGSFAKMACFCCQFSLNRRAKIDQHCWRKFRNRFPAWVDPDVEIDLSDELD